MSRISIIVVSVAIMLGFGVSVASAQGNINNSLSNLGRLGAKTGTTETDVGNVVGTAINAALTLVGIIFLILMVYAGYLWMTARGEEAPIENAKKIVRAAIIGLVLVMSAYAITFFVTARFDGNNTQIDSRACVPVDPNITAPATCAALSNTECLNNALCQLR